MIDRDDDIQQKNIDLLISGYWYDDLPPVIDMSSMKGVLKRIIEDIDDNKYDDFGKTDGIVTKYKNTEAPTYIFKDAWGNVTSSNYSSGGNISYQLNHILYRSYYKDNETNLYYLQSRYYDSEIGRFINADDVRMINKSDVIFEKGNIYVYCNNDPINAKDITGRKSLKSRESDADKLIKKYKKVIKAAAKLYGVDSKNIAGVIYGEQVLNYDCVDVLTDWLAFYGVNTSVGIGQVRLKTAEMLEKKGYIKIKFSQGRWNIFGFVIHGTTTMTRCKYLENDEINIYYVAAYLRYLQDVWKYKYPPISHSTAILATLYNTGKTAAHSNPYPNLFGIYVYSKFSHLKNYCRRYCIIK